MPSSVATLPFAITIHTAAMLAATAIGPVALWFRPPRYPRLHRAAGAVWVALMLVAAFSAFFIRSTQGLHWHGFSLLHLLIPATLGFLVLAFAHLLRGNATWHGRTMQGLYIGACMVAGAFTLLPGRRLGNLLISWF